jgi:integrase
VLSVLVRPKCSQHDWLSPVADRRLTVKPQLTAALLDPTRKVYAGAACYHFHLKWRAILDDLLRLPGMCSDLRRKLSPVLAVRMRHLHGIDACCTVVGGAARAVEGAGLKALGRRQSSRSRDHLAQFGTSPDGGRLFSGVRGGELATVTYRRAWIRARQDALTTAEQTSPLARRPYDLRHACLSTWLNGGVYPTQVAEWAGHSVDVLLRIYAKCVVGQDELAKRRISEALRQA